MSTKQTFCVSEMTTTFRVPHPKEEREAPGTLPLLTPAWLWLCYQGIWFSSTGQPPGHFSSPSLPNVLRAGNLVCPRVFLPRGFSRCLSLIPSSTQPWVNVLISKPDVELHVVPWCHSSSLSYPYVNMCRLPYNITCGRSVVCAVCVVRIWVTNSACAPCNFI